jgi:hypothetical protein
MKKDIGGSLAGHPNTTRKKQVKFSCSNLNNIGLIPRDFRPDVDPDSFECETECINRLGREEEYVNRVGSGDPPQFVCIPYFVKGHDKPFYLYHEALLRTDLWKTFRKKILSFVPSCESCGSSKRLEIHHIKYRGFYSFFDPGNVMVLCRICHAWIHRR